MPFLETEFYGDIILDKIGVITNSEASSDIDVMAKIEVGLDKYAVSCTMLAEDIIPKANCSSAAIGTRRNMPQKFFGSFIALRSKMKY